jgi:deazaflavin-dependent oxidoreductase (nitroreductase family)
VRPPKPLIRLIGRVQGAVYRTSRGRLLGRVGRAEVLLLTTTGRRSGVKRTVPLLHVVDGGRFVVVASLGGHDTHPAWYLNLRADPHATVTIGGRSLAVSAHDADPAEAEALWPALVAAYPAWEDYRRRTTRRFPVIILTAES